MRSQTSEATVLGACYLAGLGAGIWSTVDELERQWHESRRFNPQSNPEERRKKIADWHQAIHASSRGKPRPSLSNFPAKNMPHTVFLFRKTACGQMHHSLHSYNLRFKLRYRVSPVEAVPVCLARSSSTAAWAAARRAVSKRNGEHET